MRSSRSNLRNALVAGWLIMLTACGGTAETTGPDQSAPGEPTNLTASSTEVRLGAIGASAQLTAQLTDAKGRVVQSGAISWSSNDITIASVTGSGGVAMITARAPGRTTIRVSGGPLYLDIPVTVATARAISLGPSTAALRAGDTYKFTPTIDADAGAAPELQWTTENPSIATVASNGTVTGVSAGSTVVRVSVIGDARLTAIASVNVLAARSVKLSPTTLSVATQESALLQATVDVDAGQSKSLTWSSSNPAAVSVSSTGIVTGVAVGSAYVRAVSVADARARDSVPVQVTALRAVTISPSNVSIAAGETRALSAQVNMDTGGSTAVMWRSADPSVAMVSSDGLVTGVAQGNTTITAISVADTTKRGTAIVVVAPVVRDIDVQPSALSLFPGEVRTLTATVTADPGASQAVTWSSSNSAVASVNAAGAVTAIATGSAIITAVSDGDDTKSASALITVRAAQPIVVSPSSATLALNEQRTLTAIVSLPEGISRQVIWSSGDPTIVTVSTAGVVTAMAFGTTTVTATSLADPSYHGSATIVVSPQVLSIGVTPSSALIAPGGSVQLTPSVQVQGSLTTGVTYRSSNPSVASVNFAGLVSGNVAGSATITVMANADTTKKATAAIAVVAPVGRMAASWTPSRQGGALYEDVISIDGVDATSAFAVNSLGNVYRYANGAWSLSASGTNYGTQFLSVSAVSATEAMAVGSNGVIARFNGATWSTVASGTTATLKSVHLESAGVGFAVGANGTALRWNGSAWSLTPTNSTASLHAVWSTGGVAFAVGSAGELLRFSAGAWTRDTPLTTENLLGVSGTSSADVVAVGEFGTVLRYTGTWSEVQVGETFDFYAVATDATSGMSYIASDMGLLQLSGASLSVVSTPYAPRLLAVMMDESGATWTSGQRGAIMRSANGWQTLNLSPDLIDVWSTSAINAWAVGEFGSIYRFNGSSWTRQTTPTTGTLNTVWGPSSADAFAGGDNGVMLRWNGSAWTSMVFPSNANIYSLWGSSASNVYAVTSAGEVVRFNGTTWSVVFVTIAPLWSVHGTSASDVIASGENGFAMRFNGSTWSNFPTVTSGTLAGVYAGGGFYFTVGSTSTGTGVAFSSTGSSWTTVNTGSTRRLTSLWGPSSSDLYATGELGTILRYDGSGWSAMTSGTTDLLWSVSSAADGNAGFAVGYNGTIVTATSGAALTSARSSASTGTASLNPRRGAKLVRGALPSGSARAQRKR